MEINELNLLVSFFRCLCGESWGLTLGNPCMQSPYVVVIVCKGMNEIHSRSDNDRV